MIYILLTVVLVLLVEQAQKIEKKQDKDNADIDLHLI